MKARAKAKVVVLTTAAMAQVAVHAMVHVLKDVVMVAEKAVARTPTVAVKAVARTVAVVMATSCHATLIL